MLTLVNPLTVLVFLGLALQLRAVDLRSAFALSVSAAASSGCVALATAASAAITGKMVDVSRYLKPLNLLSASGIFPFVLSKDNGKSPTDLFSSSLSKAASMRITTKRFCTCKSGFTATSAAMSR